MRNNWIRRIKRFIEIFTPGGTEYTDFGTEFHVSSKGGITTPPGELAKILDRTVDEMERLKARWRAELEQRGPN